MKDRIVLAAAGLTFLMSSASFVRDIAHPETVQAQAECADAWDSCLAGCGTAYCTFGWGECMYDCFPWDDCPGWVGSC